MSAFNKNIYQNKRFLFYLGLLISFFVTFAEVIRGTHYNFLVFANATRDFWNGILPYTDEFCIRNLREYLYTPVFSVLFTPFAFFNDNIGAFLWNIFNYIMFYFAVFTLPEGKFSDRTKCMIFLYALPILAQSLFSCQYNVTVAYIYIFAYTLMEKDKSFWAILLILISGLTKIYGIFEMALIFCYPKFWKNVGYAAIMSIVLLSLPLLKLSFTEILPYYEEWCNTLMIHQSSRVWESIFYAEPLSQYLLPNFRIIQIGTLCLLIILFFLSYKKWDNSSFRAQCIGILTGWIVLMSDSSEIHTYLIAISGYLLWYWTRIHHSMLDKILFWSIFFLFCIVPIDIICPVPVMLFLTKTLWIHIWIYMVTWIVMIYKTLCIKPEQSDPVHFNEVGGDDDGIDIVCPVYNPHAGFIDKLKKCINDIRAHYPTRQIHLIISNDGSDRGFDSSVKSEIIQSIDDAEIIDNTHKGKGSAVRSGIAASKAKYAVYTDIDMPYSINSVITIMDYLLKGYDLVIATRDDEYYSNLTLKRKILSYGSKLLNRIFLGIRHTDTQGGLKGLSIMAKRAMAKTSIDGFLFDTQFVKIATEDNLSIIDIKAKLNPGIRMSNFSNKAIVSELRNFFIILLSIKS